MDGNSVPYSIKPPFRIKIGDQKVEFNSGCCVVDVTIPSTAFAEIGEIHFKNYYTASLQLKARKRLHSVDADSGKWKTVVPRFQLMPHPHCDQGAENYFCISSKQMKWLLINVVELRFILRQPSPLWKDFKIDDIRLLKTSINASSEVVLPSWITETPREVADRQLKGVPSIPALSKDLQQMWALTELSKSNQPTTKLGRYDIDGSYEINLLSYT